MCRNISLKCQQEKKGNRIKQCKKHIKKNNQKLFLKIIVNVKFKKNEYTKNSK